MSNKFYYKGSDITNIIQTSNISVSNTNYSRTIQTLSNYYNFPQSFTPNVNLEKLTNTTFGYKDSDTNDLGKKASAITYIYVGNVPTDKNNDAGHSISANTDTDTITVPSGIKSMGAYVMGGGGGGGGSAGGGSNGSGGGGPGAILYTKSGYPVTPGDIIKIGYGNGGPGGNGRDYAQKNSGNGRKGGDSYIEVGSNRIITVNGGNGGENGKNGGGASNARGNIGTVSVDSGVQCQYFQDFANNISGATESYGAYMYSYAGVDYRKGMNGAGFETWGGDGGFIIASNSAEMVNYVPFATGRQYNILAPTRFSLTTNKYVGDHYSYNNADGYTCNNFSWGGMGGGGCNGGGSGTIGGSGGAGYVQIWFYE